MSDVIQLLPDSVANQIAAGEVIQRPASVIKELVENSIDAGASQIKIILRDAGKTLIQVVDNGAGMSDTDARLAFERHATSKIRQAADLFELHTMGFRGEALPSIAAVAQIDLLTMRRDCQIGSHLQIEGSKFISQTPEACQPGTNLAVKNLFFNFPARRKFLKKDVIELGHITREFERLALVNPQVEFELWHNDVTLYQLLPGTLRERIKGLFGKAIDKTIIPVATETPLVKISGFVSLPEHARKRNPQQFFFVNGRNMRHPYFHKAVVSCYESLISPEHQPNYFLNFEVDPQSIDVNIHPTKSEIKFENEQPIWQILAAAVREALGKFNAAPTIDFDTEDAPEIPVFNPEAVTNPGLEIDSDYNPFDTGTPSPHGPAKSKNDGQSTLGASAMNSAFAGTNIRAGHLNDWDRLYNDFQTVSSKPSAVPSPESFLTDETGLPASINASAMNSFTEIEAMPHSSGLQQLANRYLVTPGNDTLIIIDRYRAQVKVLFERFIKLSGNSLGESQQVMFGDVLELSPARHAILEQISEDVRTLGYDLEITRQDEHSNSFTCEIKAIPAVLGNADPSEALLKIIDDAEEGTGDTHTQMRRRLALSLAKSAALKAGQVMPAAEAEQLLADLFALPDPNYTPDNNLIITAITVAELNRRF